MSILRVDNHKLKLDPFITQISPNGKEYYISSVVIDLSKAPEWRNGGYKHHCLVIARFKETGKFIQFTFDYNDTCIKKEPI